jgi:hypothetical protein
MKPDAQKLITGSYQIALFLKEKDFSNFNKKFAKLFEIKELANANQIVLPSFFRINSEDSSIVVQFVNGKLDIFFNVTSDDQDLSKEPAIKGKVLDLTKKILDSLNLEPIIRIGVLAHAHYPVKEYDELIPIVDGTVLSSSVAKRMTSFSMSLTFAHDTKFLSKRCNRYFEIGYGERKRNDSHATKALVISSDVNTHQEEEANFTTTNITDFILEAWPLNQSASMIDFFWE